jgi:hypothetical protein
MTLFETSWIAYKGSLEQRATQEVQQLDRQTFLNPDLVGVLDHIVEKYSLVVATLDQSKMHGTRREVRRTVDNYGRQLEIMVPMMDVVIPFTGSEDSFALAPSRYTTPSINYDVRDNYILISLPDDNLGPVRNQSLDLTMSWA